MKQTDIVIEIDRISRTLKSLKDTGIFYVPYIPVFKQPKYQFSRSKWYEAVMPWHRRAEVPEWLAWCTEQFGPGPAVRDAWTRWYCSMSVLYFRDEEDYVWFTLRWGA